MRRDLELWAALSVAALGAVMCLGAGCTATPGHCHTDGLSFESLGLEGCDGAATSEGTTTAPATEGPGTTVETTGDASSTDPLTSSTTEGLTSSTSSTSESSTGTTTDGTTTSGGVCGDGVLDDDEECDDGNLDDLDACSNACVAASCGDGVVQQGPGLEEACEGGPMCNNSCQWTTCGNAVHDLHEQCDPSADDEDAALCESFCVFKGGARALVAGDEHTCALLWGGAIRCWGKGSDGRLGYGDTNTVGNSPGSLPYLDVDLGGPQYRVLGLAAGGRHTCAYTDEGALFCWGDNAEGQLGYGNTDDVGDDEVPAEVGPVPLPVGAVVVSVAAGDAHTCVMLKDGGALCWGRGTFGQLGRGSAESLGDDESLVDLTPLLFPDDALVQAIAAGGDHSCALVSTQTGGKIRCWGRNDQGQLGHDDAEDYGAMVTQSAGASAYVMVGADAVGLRVGGRFSCGLFEVNTIRELLCWGQGASGQLGQGDTANIGDSALTTVMNAGFISTGGDNETVAAGAEHTCTILAGGAGALCWGAGANGRLGYGDSENLGDDPGEVPSAVGALTLETQAGLVAGGAHTCARAFDGAVRCWGRGSAGQLGNGAVDDIGDNEDLDAAALVPLDP